MQILEVRIIRVFGSVSVSFKLYADLPTHHEFRIIRPLGRASEDWISVSSSKIIFAYIFKKTRITRAYVTQIFESTPQKYFVTEHYFASDVSSQKKTFSTKKCFTYVPENRLALSWTGWRSISLHRNVLAHDSLHGRQTF